MYLVDIHLLCSFFHTQKKEKKRNDDNHFFASCQGFILQIFFRLYNKLISFLFDQWYNLKSKSKIYRIVIILSLTLALYTWLWSYAVHQFKLKTQFQRCHPYSETNKTNKTNKTTNKFQEIRYCYPKRQILF